MPTEINPPILITIEDAYRTVSGNTNEYHPTISPNPKRPRPIATKRVAFFLPWIYDIRVSIARDTNKINETALSMFSI